METPRHVRATNREPVSVGSFTRHVQEANDPFTERVMAFRNDDASTLEDSPDTWPAEKIKAAGDYFVKADTKLTARRENADAFVELHPEFKDNKKNADVMQRTLQTMYGDVAFSVEQYEAAYQVSCANNLLDLDGEELSRQAKQRKAEAKQRAEDRAHPVTPSESELYAMPLEDLRRLDAIENHNRMQLAGERGGNGW
jgi:hypothetical protein